MQQIVFDRSNIPPELVGKKFPKTLEGVGGAQLLGDTIFRLKSGPEGSEKYSQGTLVRLITGTRADNGKRFNSTPGFHFDPDYVTVCRIDANGAEGVGVRKNALEFVSAIPQRPLKEGLTDRVYSLRERFMG